MNELDPDAQARLFFLLILGIAVGAGVFRSYRGQLGAGMQSMAIWGLIFLGLMVAYGFRDRIGLALDDRRAEETTAGDIRLRRDDDGHFHAWLIINGVEVAFLVDTGATEIVLSPDDARAIGLDVDSLRFTQQAMTANGIVRVAPVRLDLVQLGRVRDEDMAAVVNEVPLQSSLLGMSYLDRFASMTIEGDVMTLRR